MNKKIRSFIFFSLVVIFLIISPLAIFYSQGYRFDSKNFRVVQTGSFYFKVTPRSVDIKIIEDKNDSIAMKRKTDFFFGTSYVENILPGRYKISVGKDGYHVWEKTLEVREKLVTEMKNIVLIPTDPIFSIVGGKTSNIFPLSGKREMAVKEINDKDGWNLFLYDPVGGGSTQIISSQELKEEPIDVISFYGRDEVLLKINSGWVIIDTQNEKSYSIDGKEGLFLDPKRVDSVLYLEENRLISFNYLKEETQLIAKDVISFTIRENGDIFMMMKDGSFAQNNQTLRIPRFTISEDSNCEMRLLDLELFVLKDDTLFFLDRKESLFKEISNSSHLPIFSPDKRKAAYFNDHEIYVIYLDNITDQPKKSYGESSFLTRFSETIKGVDWLTDHYLILSVGDSIKIIETDDRDQINLVDFAILPDHKSIFDQYSKRIYVISNNNLFVSRIIIS